MSSEIEGLLYRTQEGAAALDMFFSEFNDIDIFVEDLEQDNLYLMILRRILPQLRIARVFPLGGKPNVLLQLQRMKSFRDDRVRVFLLDPDFDPFLGQLVDDDAVVYLPHFCLENHLVEREAAVEIVIEHQPRSNRNDVDLKLDFDRFVSATYESLENLFLSFFMVQANSLAIKNTSSPCELYASEGDRSVICPDRVQSYIDEVADLCADAGIPVPSAPIRDDPRVQVLLDQDIRTRVSGKYVLKCLFHRQKGLFGLGSTTFDSYLYRLAKACSLAAFEPVRTKILHKLNAPPPQAAQAENPTGATG